uniref:Uncharacterized protein n=1 Tax=Arundo donax TaxID=35708 RepID=A0A0A8YXQ4_ARUDO
MLSVISLTRLISVICNKKDNIFVSIFQRYRSLTNTSCHQHRRWSCHLHGISDTIAHKCSLETQHIQVNSKMYIALAPV